MSILDEEVEKIRQVRQKIAQKYLGKVKLQGDYLRHQEKNAPAQSGDSGAAKSASCVREEPRARGS